MTSSKEDTYKRKIEKLKKYLPMLEKHLSCKDLSGDVRKKLEQIVDIIELKRRVDLATLDKIEAVLHKQSEPKMIPSGSTITVDDDDEDDDCQIVGCYKIGERSNSSSSIANNDHNKYELNAVKNALLLIENLNTSKNQQDVDADKHDKSLTMSNKDIEKPKEIMHSNSQVIEVDCCDDEGDNGINILDKYTDIFQKIDSDDINENQEADKLNDNELITSANDMNFSDGNIFNSDNLTKKHRKEVCGEKHRQLHRENNIKRNDESTEKCNDTMKKLSLISPEKNSSTSTPQALNSQSLKTPSSAETTFTPPCTPKSEKYKPIVDYSSSPASVSSDASTIAYVKRQNKKKKKKSKKRRNSVEKLEMKRKNIIKQLNQVSLTSFDQKEGQHVSCQITTAITSSEPDAVLFRRRSPKLAPTLTTFNENQIDTNDEALFQRRSKISTNSLDNLQQISNDEITNSKIEEQEKSNQSDAEIIISDSDNESNQSSEFTDVESNILQLCIPVVRKRNDTPPRHLSPDRLKAAVVNNSVNKAEEEKMVALTKKNQQKIDKGNQIKNTNCDNEKEKLPVTKDDKNLNESDESLSKSSQQIEIDKNENEKENRHRISESPMSGKDNHVINVFTEVCDSVVEINETEVSPNGHPVDMLNNNFQSNAIHSESINKITTTFHQQDNDQFRAYNTRPLHPYNQPFNLGNNQNQLANLPRAPNPSDPRHQDRLQIAQAKMKSLANNLINQSSENQYSKIPRPPSGPPLDISELPAPVDVQEKQLHHHFSPEKRNPSNCVHSFKEYEQRKAAALETKISENARQKESENEPTVQMPSSELIIDKVYRSGDYSNYETFSQSKFKIPKKANNLCANKETLSNTTTITTTTAQNSTSKENQNNDTKLSKSILKPIKLKLRRESINGNDLYSISNNLEQNKNSKMRNDKLKVPLNDFSKKNCEKNSKFRCDTVNHSFEKLEKKKKSKIHSPINNNEDSSSESMVETSATSTGNETTNNSSSRKGRKRRKNEVIKLHENIQESFIRDQFMDVDRERKSKIIANDKIRKEIMEEDSFAKTIEKRRKSVTENNDSDTDSIADSNATEDLTDCFTKSLKNYNSEMYRPVVKLKRLEESTIIKYLASPNSCAEQNLSQNDSTELLTVLKTVPESNVNKIRNRRLSVKNNKLEDKLNINKEHHIGNKTCMTLCFLCHKSCEPAKIVAHYVQQHPDHEVYVSRLHSDMIEALERNNNIAKELYNKKYKTNCVFCRKELLDNFVKFNEHYSLHTGEYSYICSDCDWRTSNKNQMQTHCKQEHPKSHARPEKYYTFNEDTDSIFAHICIQCNYIQLHKANIEKHYKTQHKIIPSESDILKVKLVQRFSNEMIDNEAEVAVESHTEQIETNIQSQSMIRNIKSEEISIEENTVFISNRTSLRDGYMIQIHNHPTVTKTSSVGQLNLNIDSQINTQNLTISNTNNQNVQIEGIPNIVVNAVEFLSPVDVKNLLKPWCRKANTRKTQNQCDKMRIKLEICKLFKCMENNCDFSTNSDRDFIFHLDNNHKKDKKFDCCYCDLQFDSINLKNHILLAHETNIYQCPYCFYRTITIFNIKTHFILYHQNVNYEVYLCHTKNMVQISEMEAILQKRNDIRPINCTLCSEKFFAKTFLYDHIRNYHCITEDKILPDVDLFTCLYCNINFNTIDNIRIHLCNSHPEKYLYAGFRHPNTNLKSFNSNYKCTAMESTSIVYVGEPFVCKIYRYEITMFSECKDALDLRSDNLITTLVDTCCKKSTPLYEIIEKLMDVLRYDDIKSLLRTLNSEQTLYLQDDSKYAKKLLKVVTRKTGLSGNKLYVCAKKRCDKTFNKLFGTVNHMLQEHVEKRKKLVECPHCVEGAPWLNVDGYALHLQQKHVKHNYFCDVCFETFLNYENTVKHMSQEHRITNYKIIKLVCDDKIERQIKRKEYFIVQDQIKNYDRSSLIGYLIKKLEQKCSPNELELIKGPQEENQQKEIPVAAKLLKLQTFENKLPVYVPEMHRFTCNYGTCNFRESNQLLFESHIKISHSTFTNYKCLNCDYEVAADITKFNVLRNHWQQHGSEIYVCIECEEYFTLKAALMKHITKIHANRNITIVKYIRSSQWVKKIIQIGITVVNDLEDTASVYRCWLCCEKFNNTNCMTLHMLQSHNAVEQYECSYCDECQFTKDTIREHFEKSHRNYIYRYFLSFYKKGDNDSTKCDYTTLISNSNNINNSVQFNSNDNLIQIHSQSSTITSGNKDDLVIVLEDNENFGMSSPGKENNLKRKSSNEMDVVAKRSKIISEKDVCPYVCNFETVDKNEMGHHLKYNHIPLNKNKHQELVNTPRISTSIDGLPEFKCKISQCSFICDNQKTLEEHKLINHKRDAISLIKPKKELQQQQNEQERQQQQQHQKQLKEQFQQQQQQQQQKQKQQQQQQDHLQQQQEQLQQQQKQQQQLQQQQQQQQQQLQQQQEQLQQQQLLKEAEKPRISIVPLKLLQETSYRDPSPIHEASTTLPPAVVPRVSRIENVDIQTSVQSSTLSESNQFLPQLQQPSIIGNALNRTVQAQTYVPPVAPSSIVIPAQNFVNTNKPLTLQSYSSTLFQAPITNRRISICYAQPSQVTDITEQQLTQQVSNGQSFIHPSALPAPQVTTITGQQLPQQTKRVPNGQSPVTSSLIRSPILVTSESLNINQNTVNSLPFSSHVTTVTGLQIPQQPAGIFIRKTNTNANGSIISSPPPLTSNTTSPISVTPSTAAKIVGRRSTFAGQSLSPTTISTPSKELQNTGTTNMQQQQMADLLQYSIKEILHKLDVVLMCFKCEFGFYTIDDLIVHWHRQHDNKNEFQYRLNRKLSCMYCRVQLYFEQMQEHTKQRHPNEIFVSRTPLNPTKCTECNFDCNDTEELRKLRAHSSVSHRDLIKRKRSSFASILNQSVIDTLLKIGPYHKNNTIKFGCLKCSDVHYFSERSALDHLRLKHIPYTKINDLSKILENNMEFYLEYLTVIFPNGLTLVKGDLINTNLCNMQKFKQLIETVESSQSERNKSLISHTISKLSVK